MRVALIGNMNNNHFSLMRHLRDLGADAHLFLYANELGHFRPQNDTLMWDRWRPYVHELGISNGGLADLYGPLRHVERRLAAFDAFLGNGVAPVLFDRLGWRLDVFAPYGDGIEFIIEHEWNASRPFRSLKSWLRKTAMERAIVRSVEVAVSANVHDHSLASFRRLGKTPANKFFPMLYDEEAGCDDVLDAQQADAAARMDASSVAVFSHVSHFWKTLPVAHYMAGVGKRNQWLIEGFARYVRDAGDAKALLTMVEYGPDVTASRELADRLGISGQVLWLPVMTRVQIMALLDHADLGASEFAGMLWGGAGWEFLSKGVPMLHFLENPENYALPGRPLPPFFNVASPDDIATVLHTHDRSGFKQKGAAAKAWYDRYQGRPLAAEYLAMLETAAHRRSIARAA